MGTIQSAATASDTSLSSVETPKTPYENELSDNDDDDSYSESNQGPRSEGEVGEFDFEVEESKEEEEAELNVGPERDESWKINARLPIPDTFNPGSISRLFTTRFIDQYDLINPNMNKNSDPQTKDFFSTFYIKLPLEIKMMIKSHILDLPPRDIRAIYDLPRGEWTYRDRTNKIPLAILNSKGRIDITNTPHPRTYLKPAPCLSANCKPYKYMDYERDLLILEIIDCGGEDTDRESIHRDALTTVLSALQSPVAIAELRFLQIEFCPTYYDAADILHDLVALKTLESVILCAHNHYERPGENTWDSYLQGKDDIKMYADWERCNDMDVNFAWEFRNHNSDKVGNG